MTYADGVQVVPARALSRSDRQQCRVVASRPGQLGPGFTSARVAGAGCSCALRPRYDRSYLHFAFVALHEPLPDRLRCDTRGTDPPVVVTLVRVVVARASPVFFEQLTDARMRSSASIELRALVVVDQGQDVVFTLACVVEQLAEAVSLGPMPSTPPTGRCIRLRLSTRPRSVLLAPRARS